MIHTNCPAEVSLEQLQAESTAIGGRLADAFSENDNPLAVLLALAAMSETVCVLVQKQDHADCIRERFESACEKPWPSSAMPLFTRENVKPFTTELVRRIEATTGAVPALAKVLAGCAYFYGVVAAISSCLPAQQADDIRAEFCRITGEDWPVPKRFRAVDINAPVGQA